MPTIADGHRACATMAVFVGLVDLAPRAVLLR
jgi:hypothetical protein